MITTILFQSLFFLTASLLTSTKAFSINFRNPSGFDFNSKFHNIHLGDSELSRRKALQGILGISFSSLGIVASKPLIASAYTPDPDALRESLYLICRVQEATCLQERYIDKKTPPLQKMKLTLRLVDRSYKLLDQVNYVSKFIPGDDIVAASQAGNEAADALQDAIDFVYGFKKDANLMTTDQKEFVKAALSETREKLFEFLEYLPDQNKLAEARTRVEEENKLNVDEFDPDLATDAGIYNPIVLPWKITGNNAAA